MMTVLGPSVFGFIWIAIFGGTAIHLQSSGAYDIWNSIQSNGMESTVFAIFNNMPFSKLFITVFIFAVFASLVTYADPMTSVLATLSCKSVQIDEEPPKVLKLIWGLAVGTIAYLIIATGGINGIRGMFTLIGFPALFLMMAIGASAIRCALMIIDENRSARKAARQSKRKISVNSTNESAQFA